MKETVFNCATDCFLENEHGEILMIHRNDDKEILPGFYNGIGGRMEAGETPYEAIVREIREEAGTDAVSHITPRGILTVNDKFGTWQIYIFSGTVDKKSVPRMIIREGKLEWIAKDTLKDVKLVPDVHPWIDLLWQDDVRFFFAKVEYDDDYRLTKEVEIKTIPST